MKDLLKVLKRRWKFLLLFPSIKSDMLETYPDIGSLFEFFSNRYNFRIVFMSCGRMKNIFKAVAIIDERIKC